MKTSIRKTLTVGAVLAASFGATQAHAARPLQTAVTNAGAFYEPYLPTMMQHVKKAGANAIRLYVGWSRIAPGGSTRPAGFNAADPADPHYRWVDLDDQVKRAKALGLEPIISVETAPEWAQRTSGWDGGTNSPDPAEFGAFGQALAKRYSGSFQGLPRVKYYEAWNEPNHYRHLNPQFETAEPGNDVPSSAVVAPGTPFQSADIYRAMLNAFALGVHGAHADNLVVAGGLSTPNRPFRHSPAVAPLAFMRALLSQPAHFDVWAMQPYTSGSPDHHAASSDDVSIPDLPKVRQTLQGAVAAGRVVGRSKPQLWVTEWSWDSNPPDPGGVPAKLHARWVSEALYRMWTYGVSLATWFQIRDDVPRPGQPFSDSFQSGLYFNGGTDPKSDKPKLALEAYRFPFVAYKRSGRVLVWGRTPFGKRGRVTVKQKGGASFDLKADGFGIFTKLLKTKKSGDLVARFGRESSLPFSLKVPPDRPGNPFG